ncbi:MAG: hypothetical protein IIB69_12520 [Proteobacteria bacterium]|nr:hypothetical protein [Pseudomonadota bacterium]
MHLFRDSRVSTVLEDPKQLRWGQLSSRITYTFQFLALIAMDGMYAGFAGAKTCHEKFTIFQGTL